MVENDSFDQQARALYFDLGTSGEFKNTGADGATGQARTVDYIDPAPSISKRPGVVTSKLTNSAERGDGKRSANKQKFIEQSVKA